MKSIIYDVIVIGGGPAGMMSAGRAAEMGKSVLLLEKNSTLGKKLLITGGGRCNITNYKPEIETLVSSYRNKPKPLYSVFSQFGVEDTIEYFLNHGLEFKQEAEGRMFPITEQAESVWEVLVNNLKANNVKVKSKSQVRNITFNKQKSEFVIELENEKLISRSCIVATGGTSHPETGSTGDGYKWLKNLGHTIIDNSFALVPVALKDTWVKNLAGVALKDIKITIIQDTKKIESRNGKMLFTHLGISGPAVLNLSSKIGDLLQYGKVSLELDLLPDKDYGTLNLDLQKIFSEDINKKIKNTLSKLIPSSIVKFILEFAKVDPEKFNNSITKEERIRLVNQIKAIELNVKNLLGSDKAIVSSGGVKIEEVNFKTMESRIIPNLYVIGDLLNIDRPSGGYSLQLCWATGYVAGTSC